MSRPEDLKGPYIVWQNYGYDGWTPHSYATLSEALAADRYATEWIITKRVEYTVEEKVALIGNFNEN